MTCECGSEDDVKTYEINGELRALCADHARTLGVFVAADE